MGRWLCEYIALGHNGAWSVLLMGAISMVEEHNTNTVRWLVTCYFKQTKKLILLLGLLQVSARVKLFLFIYKTHSQKTLCTYWKIPHNTIRCRLFPHNWMIFLSVQTSELFVLNSNFIGSQYLQHSPKELRQRLVHLLVTRPLSLIHLFSTAWAYMSKIRVDILTFLNSFQGTHWHTLLNNCYWRT